jgi:hypothetical protein
MPILYYIFFIFVILVPVGHWIILTVNEEFFVFASFFIFIDLFGLTFTKLISDSVIPMQQRIAMRFRNVIETDLAVRINLQASYNQIIQLIDVATNVRKQFYEELYALIRQRKTDIKLFTIQARTITYRIIQLYELDLDRFGSYLTGNDQMDDLNASLRQLPAGIGAAHQQVNSTYLAQVMQLLVNSEQ